MSSEPKAPTSSEEAQKQKGTEPVDPENLSGRIPAVVDIDGQGGVYVATAKTKDNGWVYIQEWDGTRTELPAHRINQIRRIRTEYYGDTGDYGSRPKRIADESWRDRARDIR